MATWSCTLATHGDAGVHAVKSGGLCMCTAGARGAETDRGGPARRGPKNNGRGSAPNVRAWGARQLTIGMVCLYAFLSGEVAAYTAMLVAVTSRVTPLSGTIVSVLCVHGPDMQAYRECCGESIFFILFLTVRK